MSLGERFIEAAARTTEGYARKVRLLAVIYVGLNAVSLTVVGVVGWRIRLLVTLAQRSNVETLVLAIVVVLALYYVASTARGCVGGFRILCYSLPRWWGADALAIQQRKHRALRDGGVPLIVCFDHTIHRADGRDAAVTWALEDGAGKLGDLVVDGAVAEFRPAKAGVNNSLFEFLNAQINLLLRRRCPPSRLTIAYWGNIDEEAAAVYRSAVVAIDRLGSRIGGTTVWPTIALTADDVGAVGQQLRRLVPALRNEALLPDLEYEVEYSIPILPEPLAFVQLKRTERRVDPTLTMGYALTIMSIIAALTLLAVLFPPWVPSK